MAGQAGYPGFNPRTITDDELDIVIHYDTTVTLRDGTKIYADVYLPKGSSKYPVLLAWTPYGKHVQPFVRWENLKGSGVPTNVVSKYVGFETPDPGFWCNNGYAVVIIDPRGLWNSEGDASYMSDQEAQDCYDSIEWAGTQTWSQGDVGMSGVSYLAWSQWRVAALNPPHLKAIHPNEGVTDFYSELAYHGGIHATFADGITKELWGYGRNLIEDVGKMVELHPLITVPAYVVAGWGDFGLHSRGTLEGFKKIKSTHKWLRVHGRRNFQSYYEDQERQRQFFDKFLKGIESEVDYWPKVLIEIRERSLTGNDRAEREWPLARTRYTGLYLNSAAQSLSHKPSEKRGKAQYDVGSALNATEELQFEYTFPEDTELTGHSKLRLWVETQGNDDMDMFVILDKIDRTGDPAPLPWASTRVDGPFAKGWLRVSHRELDTNLSTPQRPVLRHARELKLKPHEIVPVDIEIWATSILFRSGERLRLTLNGSDTPLPSGMHPMNGHPNNLNKGVHVVHTGGLYDSHLLIPVIPRG